MKVIFSLLLAAAVHANEHSIDPLSQHFIFKRLSSYDVPPSGPVSSPTYTSTSKDVYYPQAEIVRHKNENDGLGNYHFEFATANNIQQHETGNVRNIGTRAESSVVRGSFSYIGTDSKVYSVDYTADENGFRPSGSHLAAASVPPIIREPPSAIASRGYVSDGIRYVLN